MTTGLYAALAASASVFIGVLTALLASDLANLKSERNLIKRRIQSIDSQVQGLNQEKRFLEDNTLEIEDQLYPEKTIFSPNTKLRNKSDGKVVADKQVEIHHVREHNERHRRWNQIQAEIKPKKKERRKLVDRFKSLDPNRIQASLHVSIITIVLSVGVPLVAYLSQILNTSPVFSPNWLEPVIIFIVWVCGLGCVFCHLRKELDFNTNSFPEYQEK